MATDNRYIPIPSVVSPTLPRKESPSVGAYCTSNYVGTENVRRTLDLDGSVKRRTTVTKMRALADESRTWLALKHELKTAP